MSVETLRPTAYTAPAPGAGTAACTATATTATCTSSKNCTSTSLLQRSASFHTWATPAHQDDYSSLTLKVEWTLAALAGDACAGIASMRLEYSTNDGDTWAAFTGFPKAATGSPQSGTASKTLSVSQDLSQLRVRVVLEIQIYEHCTGPSDPEYCILALTGTVGDVYTRGDYTSGACCTNGTCTITTPSQCGGTFVGGTCGSQTCVETRPCCKPDTTCAKISEAACTAAGGTWYPNKTSCSQVNCTQTLGCCIRAGGTCDGSTTQAACSNPGDVWLGPGTSCTVAPDDHDCVTCSDVGACCKGDGSCIRASRCWCEHAGGVFRGVGSDCDPLPCGHRIRVLMV